MKFTLAFVLTLVAAASAASVDVGLVQRQDNCASKGDFCCATKTDHWKPTVVVLETADAALAQLARVLTRLLAASV
ncbi:hypothetical protein COL26b_005884 [Colletotrichum chrysophilum]|uniref:uncharacterized protein n=1 Tax=Colletotrichum chrysophilum TaxID=1836956 RepID=UPI0023010C69|nr:uncharacterized protein COL26b_005884 [Colletotrichum chrysophilum]KAJ0375909.1 hypothetical protein COL26b_005884 [Colletotrichum chrysophilum]